MKTFFTFLLSFFTFSSYGAEVTTFLMVRHGETARNEAGQHIGGQIDLQDDQLNKQGRKQADVVGRKLAERYKDKLVAIYTSTLGRAKETAQIIGRYFPHVPIVEDRRLMEFKHGRYDTMNHAFRNKLCTEKLSHLEASAKARGENVDRFFKWRFSLADLVPYSPGMTAVPCEGDPETGLEAFQRVTAAIDEIHQKHPGSTVLIVSHGGIIKTIGYEAESRMKKDHSPLPLFYEPAPKDTQIQAKNCSVTYFEKSAGGELVFVKTEQLQD